MEMLKAFKLKHIDMLVQDEIDYAQLMKDLDGYKNPRWNRSRAFVKSFGKVYSFVESIKNVDPKTIQMNPHCDIKVPSNIDGITYAAMIAIYTLKGNPGDKLIGELMSEVIALACYSENNEAKFDIESDAFKEFKDRIYDSPAFDMIGLYNHIEESIRSSSDMWEKLFQEVYEEDIDYMNAGGEKMNNFNVINTIKAICQDFNVSYEEAWQMPYGVTQTNSLSKATAASIQSRMTKIKEDRMKSQRRM